MKIVKLILFISILANSLSAQNIVTNAFVSQSIISLGTDAKVTFNVNKITTCDSYNTEWDINYFAKTIKIILNYNYFSNCAASNTVSFESVSKPILLEGTYWVTLDVKVASNSSLNQSISLLSIFVNKPLQINCMYPFIPFLQGFCPSYLNQVCACNGKTYQNECEAFLRDKNGLYQNGICPTCMNTVSKPFECKTYNSNESYNAFLAKYSCSNELFNGKELVLKYIQNQTSDLKIEYNSMGITERVFLTKIVDNNLHCILSSNNGLLEVPMLPASTYYIIVENFNTLITFCNPTSTVELVNENIKSFPNPANDKITVMSDLVKINFITITDYLGRTHSTELVNAYEKDICVRYMPKGMYILKIHLNNGNAISRKTLLY